MTKITKLYLFKIEPIMGSYHPAYAGIYEQSINDRQDGIDLIKGYADSSTEPVWGTVRAQRFGRENQLDIRADPDGSAMFGFQIADDCQSHFDSKPFLDLDIAGAPSGGIFLHKHRFGAKNNWAAFELKEHKFTDFARLPIILNFVDTVTNKSPFFLPPHLVHFEDHDHKHSESQKTHGGIHPPTVSSNINLF